jgi:hypothetical protein
MMTAMPRSRAACAMDMLRSVDQPNRLEREFPSETSPVQPSISDRYRARFGVWKLGGSPTMPGRQRLCTSRTREGRVPSTNAPACHSRSVFGADICIANRLTSAASSRCSFWINISPTVHHARRTLSRASTNFAFSDSTCQMVEHVQQLRSRHGNDE